MKARCKSFFEKYDEVLLLFFFFLINILCHSAMELNGDASTWYAHSLDEQTMYDFLKLRYFSWSSRTLIDCVMVSLCYVPIVIWRIADSLVLAAIGYYIIKIVEIQDISIKVCVYVLCLIYPFIDMNTAGWLATTLNYCWPLLGILIGIYYVLLSFKKRLNILQVVVGSLGCLFATNVEQGVVIFLLFLVGCDLFGITHKKWSKFLCLANVYTVVELVYIVLSPGNAQRAISEASSFPEFITLSFIEKCGLGISSTLYYFIFSFRPLFILFVISLMFMIFSEKKNCIFRTIAMIPFFVSVAFGVFKKEIYAIYPWLADFENAMTITGVDGKQTVGKACWFVLGLVVISIVICICVVIKEEFEAGIGIISSIALGFASRCMMGFSPTIWISSDRTYIFLYFSFIISIIYLLKVMKNLQMRNTLISTTIILGIMSSLHLLVYTGLGSF